MAKTQGQKNADQKKRSTAAKQSTLKAQLEELVDKTKIQPAAITMDSKLVPTKMPDRFPSHGEPGLTLSDEDKKVVIDQMTNMPADNEVHPLLKGIMDRPIAFIDLETTGTDKEESRIVEISVLIVYPDGSEETKTRLINPGIPIPPEATAVHGIDDEKVKDAPLFRSVAKGLHELIEGCDIAGFNSNQFDCPLLFNEFARAGIVWKYRHNRLIDVRTIWVRKEPRDLAAAYQYYCGATLEGAHGAEADIRATKEIFMAQLAMYKDLPKETKDLAFYSNYDKPIVDISGKFTLDADGDIVFAFGPSERLGKKAKDNKSFLEWMLKQPFFSDDTKAVVNIAKYNKTVTQ